MSVAWPKATLSLSRTRSASPAGAMTSSPVPRQEGVDTHASSNGGSERPGNANSDASSVRSLSETFAEST